MTAIKDLQKLKDEMDKSRKEIESKCKKVFSDAANEIFVNHPKLESFSWRQYTPYFNDGDTCTFGVRNDYIEITFDGEEFEEISTSTFNPEYRKYSAKEQDTIGLKEAFGEIRSLLDVFSEDDYEFMFGDHVRVTVTKNGAETEEYEHD